MVGIGSSCGACKFLRRKCTDLCIFAPYFSYDHAEVHFAAVHRVFGASNVSKLLSHLPVYHRGAAAITVSFEAQARMRDPVRGCVSQILALQQQVVSLQEEIDRLKAQLAGGSNYDGFYDDLQPCIQMNYEFGEANKQQELIMKSAYKEAIDRLEHCLFSDEPCQWGEEVALETLEGNLLY